jgi:hypothetical protein
MYNIIMEEKTEKKFNSYIQSTDKSLIDGINDETPPAMATPITSTKSVAKKIAQPVAVNIEAVRDSLPQPAGEAVVGNGVVDTVSVSSIVYKNLYAKKSLSVHHLQRRLNELNYTEAYEDRDGWFGDKTKSALARFQADNKVGANGVPDLDTLKKLFAGDPNVEISK